MTNSVTHAGKRKPTELSSSFGWRLSWPPEWSRCPVVMVSSDGGARPQASWTTWNIKGIQAVLGTQSRNISWCHKICFVVWVGQGHLGRIFSVIRI